MKILSILFLFFSGFFLSLPIFSQNIDPGLIENLSQEQIEIIKNISDQDIIQTNTFKEVSESTVKIEDDDSTELKEDLDGLKEDDDLARLKYGYSFFSSMPTSIAAVGDLPLPNDYRISLKDEFSVILSGSKKAIFNLQVNLDGTILFPELGPISVVGETFKDVKSKIRNLIEASFIGTQIDLSIKNLSAKKVTIVGAVNAPGTYLVNPFSTITSALAYSGGISEIGTLRKIKLIRNTKEVFYFDLYDLLISGNRSDDITVEAGDVIIIDPAKQFVKLSGGVIRPKTYEVIEGEDFSDLLSFGLGFTDIANKTNINAKLLDLKSGEIKNITKSDITFKLSNVLSVNVNQYVSKNTSSIEVIGAIKEPGFYLLEEYDTLQKLIEAVEFIDVYPWLAILEQFDENNLIKSSILFNLKQPDTYESIKLLPNSKIYFSNINSIFYDVEKLTKIKIEDYSLTINHKQENYVLPVYGKFSIKAFVDYLGIDMTDVDPVATYLSPLDNIILKEDYKTMEFIAKKFHTVSFRSPVNDLINVTVEGAVDFPGSYTLNANATMDELFSLLGDFKSEANLNGIVLIRESVKNRQIEALERSQLDLQEALAVSSAKGENVVDIFQFVSLSEQIENENLGRISGDFSPNSLSSKRTILSDGDLIRVPKNSNTINVLGHVLNPTSFLHLNNPSVYTAINSAGGFKDYANKNKIYVIKANGTIIRQRASTFAKVATLGIFPRSIRLEPGDSVVVPRKMSVANPITQSLLPITQVISDLAFAAAAIDSLSD